MSSVKIFCLVVVAVDPVVGLVLPVVPVVGFDGVVGGLVVVGLLVVGLDTVPVAFFFAI